MKSAVFPLAMPEDLLGEVRSAATRTGLSMADILRQSTKLGLPKLLEQMTSSKVSPMTKEEAKAAYGPNAEFDALESHMAKRPARAPEAD
jgi:hypothetical protein